MRAALKLWEVGVLLLIVLVVFIYLYPYQYKREVNLFNINIVSILDENSIESFDLKKIFSFIREIYDISKIEVDVLIPFSIYNISSDTICFSFNFPICTNEDSIYVLDEDFNLIPTKIYSDWYRYDLRLSLSIDKGTYFVKIDKSTIGFDCKTIYVYINGVKVLTKFLNNTNNYIIFFENIFNNVSEISILCSNFLYDNSTYGVLPNSTEISYLSIERKMTKKKTVCFYAYGEKYYLYFNCYGEALFYTEFYFENYTIFYFPVEFKLDSGTKVPAYGIGEKCYNNIFSLNGIIYNLRICK